MIVKAWEVKIDDCIVLPKLQLLAGVKGVEYITGHGAEKVRLSLYNDIKVTIPSSYEVDVINF